MAMIMNKADALNLKIRDKSVPEEVIIETIGKINEFARADVRQALLECLMVHRPPLYGKLGDKIRALRITHP